MRGTLEERLNSRVDRRGPDECWLWRGALNNCGYGVLRDEDGTLTTAHRAALRLDGRDPGPLMALHSCDTPACVNPAHLRAGTRAENVAEMVERGRSMTGERNHRARLTADQVRQIRELAATMTRRELAARFSVSQTAVTLAVQRRTWAHL